MPVTARLSLLLYERLGDQVVNELVDWFNAVDATYRADLRELNELNFARFDAKLEERIGTLASRFDAKLEQQTAELATRIIHLDSRIDQLESRLEAKLERRLGEQTRWFIAAWAVVLGAVIGLWFRK